MFENSKSMLHEICWFIQSPISDGGVWLKQSECNRKYDGDPIPLRLMLLNNSKTNICQVKILKFMVFIKKAIMI